MEQEANIKIEKNFQNACLYSTGFQIDAEWYFFATSHSKSACDGVGGTEKRLTAKASCRKETLHRLNRMHTELIDLRSKIRHATYAKDNKVIVHNTPRRNF